MEKRKMTLKLGFMPTRRNMYGEKAFNAKSAGEMKRKIEAWLIQKGIDYVNLDFLNEEGLLYHPNDVDAVYKYFVQQDVDAIFCPHCNFGAEDAVAKVCERLKKPVLLWGPREDEPDEEGYRYRDSQCGLFATTKVLQRVGVPFSYITNCHLQDAMFERLFENFISAAMTVKYFMRMRLGQISLRPDAFWSVKCNEGELLERYGIDLVPITLPELRKRYDDALVKKKDEIAARAEETAALMKAIHFPKEKLINVAALVTTIKDWADEQNLTATATQCWGPMFDTIGISPCFALSELNGLGLPSICECDIHGAVSAVMAQAASRFTSPIFLADVTARHPEKENVELFWHCGVFPKELAREDKPKELNLHYNRKAPVVGNWELKGGRISLVRFDGVQGNYSLLMGQGAGTDGPYNHGTYVWLEFEDWSKWENKFIYGPYIHHCAGVHACVTPALYEACRYIPGLMPDPVEPEKEKIEQFLRGKEVKEFMQEEGTHVQR